MITTHCKIFRDRVGRKVNIADGVTCLRLEETGLGECVITGLVVHGLPEDCLVRVETDNRLMITDPRHFSWLNEQQLQIPLKRNELVVLIITRKGEAIDCVMDTEVTAVIART